MEDIKVTTKQNRFEMRLDDIFIRKVDEWRRKQDIIPSRAAAIRYLAEYAINIKENTCNNNQ